MRVVNDNRKVLRIDAPEWFALPAFKAALDRGTAPDTSARLATYHNHGELPNEYSDIFVPFEAQTLDEADGSSRWILTETDLFDEPGLEEVREAVAAIAERHGVRRGVFWITNVGVV